MHKRYEQKINQYTICNKYFGLNSAVYFCETQEHEFKVLKTLTQPLTKDSLSSKRFFRESLIWISLRSLPNIVTLQKIEYIDNHPYLVLEWVSPKNTNPSLKEFLRKETDIDLKTKFLIMRDIAYGMWSASQLVPGIIHGDLRLENILLETNDSRVPSVKITDFGLAQVLTQGKAGENPLFTNLYNDRQGGGLFDYLAPELWTGAPQSIESDIYAFGCLFIQVLLGRTQSFAETIEKIIEMHSQGKIIDLLTKDSSIYIRQFVSKCLQLETSERMNDWEDVLSGIHWVYETLTQKKLQRSGGVLDQELEFDIIKHRSNFESKLTLSESLSGGTLSYVYLTLAGISIEESETVKAITNTYFNQKQLSLENKDNALWKAFLSQREIKPRDSDFYPKDPQFWIEQLNLFRSGYKNNISSESFCYAVLGEISFENKNFLDGCKYYKMITANVKNGDLSSLKFLCLPEVLNFLDNINTNEWSKQDNLLFSALLDLIKEYTDLFYELHTKASLLTSQGFYNEALNILRPLSMMQMGTIVADCLGNLGYNYWLTGKSYLSIMYSNKAIATLGDSRYKESEHSSAYYINNRSVALSQLDAFDRSIQDAKSAINIARLYGDHNLEYVSQGSLSIALAGKREYKRALDTLEAVASKLQNNDLYEIMWQLGITLNRKGDIQNGAKLLMKVLNYEKSINHNAYETHASWFQKQFNGRNL